MSAAPAPTQCLLEALESFRDLDARISLNSIVAFLHLCSSEGAGMKELAFRCGMTEATASRAVRSLEMPTAATVLPPGLGLVEIARSAEDGRSRLVFLTPEGRALRDTIARRIKMHADMHVNT